MVITPKQLAEEKRCAVEPATFNLSNAGPVPPFTEVERNEFV